MSATQSVPEVESGAGSGQSGQEVEGIPEFRLWDPEFVRNPYPHLRALREQDPIHRIDFAWAWVLTRYDHCVEVLRDGRCSSALRDSTLERQSTPTSMPARHRSALQTFFGHAPLFVDRGDHTRLRGLVNRGFTPRMVTGLRPRIQAIVDGLVDALEDLGEADFLASFADPLPAIVIAEMLGVPLEDRPLFERWSDGMTVLFDLVKTDEDVRRAAAGMAEMQDYLGDLIRERRRHRSDDLISALVEHESGGDTLSEVELLAMCTLLLAAGHETTTNLLGNGLYALLQHPAELERLRADASLIPGGVEELLRFYSPVQGMPRVAQEELDFHGHRVAAGDMFVVVVAAANRDPAVFPEPDRLDVGRPNNRHLAFGNGAHFCLGAPLARAEAQIAFSALLRRFPRLELAAEPRWRPRQVLRGLESLRVVFGRQAE